MKTIWIIASLASLSSLAGCGSARAVSVTGETSAAAQTAVSGPVHIEFYDLPVDASGAVKLLDHVDLDKPGSFTHSVDAEGSKLRIFAINDLNKDGKCSAGEAWGEIDVAIGSDNTVSGAALPLALGPCPDPLAAPPVAAAAAPTK